MMTVPAAWWLPLLSQASEVAPLPARSPIGGPLWSYVIPAALLTVASLGTFLLYRHFAKREDLKGVGTDLPNEEPPLA
jgi:hypothetical protein